MAVTSCRQHSWRIADIVANLSNIKRLIASEIFTFVAMPVHDHRSCAGFTTLEFLHLRQLKKKGELADQEYFNEHDRGIVKNWQIFFENRGWLLSKAYPQGMNAITLTWHSVQMVYFLAFLLVACFCQYVLKKRNWLHLLWLTLSQISREADTTPTTRLWRDFMKAHNKPKETSLSY